MQKKIRAPYTWKTVDRPKVAKRQRTARASKKEPRPKSFAEWMFEMYGWANRVHRDILRLERQCGLKKGAPGSPPLPPPPPRQFELL